LTFEDQLAELKRQGRFEAAAELAERAQNPLEAARLWEQACKFDQAARRFLEAERADEALLQAARAGDAALIEACLTALTLRTEVLEATSVRLEARGFYRVAAQIQERLQDLDAAAKLYQRANHHVDAARLRLRAGHFDAALESLEHALAREASDDIARLALATLLERRGRLREAAGHLQKLDQRSALAAPAMRQLARIFTRLELPGAAREVILRAARLPASGEKPPGVLLEFEAREASKEQEQNAPEVLLGRYAVLELIATTATARVYKAHDRLLQEPVAVKLFSPSLTTGTGRDAFFRFEREVQVLEELKHPAVLPLFAYHPEGPALILKWMPGGSLASRLEAEALSPELGALIVTRVLSALSEAHRRGILHRDIKPDNILFDEHGTPYLSDFGTAHVADHAQTVTQGMLGTLAYMAPAQRQGQPATIQSDLYSVGAVFWHVLSGGPPGSDLPLSNPALSPSQRELARRLVDSAALPDNASEMLSLVRKEVWPATPAREPEQRSPRPTPAPEAPARLISDGQRSFDRLLERPVVVLDSSLDTLGRAGRFAAAGHPGLSAILMYDADKQLIWLESLESRDPGQLTPAQKDTLRTALIRLHDVGGSHGSVDQAHLGWRGSEPALVFPSATKPATLREDLAKLELVR
jgi:serine/threonine-protein kinase